MLNIGEYVRGLLRRFSRQDYSLVMTEQRPSQESVKDGVIYVVGSQGYAKWAYLRCPCPQHDVIMLNLSKHRRPAWTVRVKGKNIPDIYPSIWQLDGCYSHFWIRDGKVNWAKGSGSPPRRVEVGELMPEHA